jgi:uncharacterized membrane protein
VATAPTLHRVLLVVILIGLGLAIYAAVESIDTSSQVCNVNSVVSCGKVDSSHYTTVGPVHDYWIGIAGFAILLALDIPLLLTYDVRYLYGILGFAGLGLAFAVGFGAIEVFLIHALCPVCFGTYLADAGVLAAALGLLRMRRSAAARSATDAAVGAAPGPARPS